MATLQQLIDADNQAAADAAAAAAYVTPITYTAEGQPVDSNGTYSPAYAPDAGATRNPYSTATSGYTTIPTTDLQRWLNHSWGATSAGLAQFLKERFPGGIDESIMKDGNLYVKPKNPAESSNAFITQLQTSNPDKWEVPKPAPGLGQGILNGDAGGFTALLAGLATAGLGSFTGLTDILGNAASGFGGAGDVASALSLGGENAGIIGSGESAISQLGQGLASTATTGANMFDWQDPSTWGDLFSDPSNAMTIDEINQALNLGGENAGVVDSLTGNISQLGQSMNGRSLWDLLTQNNAPPGTQSLLQKLLGSGSGTGSLGSLLGGGSNNSSVLGSLFNAGASAIPSALALNYANNLKQPNTDLYQGLFDKAGDQSGPLGMYDLQSGIGRNQLNSSLAQRNVLGSSFGDQALTNYDTTRGLGRGQVALTGLGTQNKILDSMNTQISANNAVKTGLLGTALKGFSSSLGGNANSSNNILSYLLGQMG